MSETLSENLITFDAELNELTEARGNLLSERDGLIGQSELGMTEDLREALVKCTRLIIDNLRSHLDLYRRIIDWFKDNRPYDQLLLFYVARERACYFNMIAEESSFDLFLGDGFAERARSVDLCAFVANEIVEALNDVLHSDCEDLVVTLALLDCVFDRYSVDPLKNGEPDAKRMAVFTDSDEVWFHSAVEFNDGVIRLGMSPSSDRGETFDLEQTQVSKLLLDGRKIGDFDEHLALFVGMVSPDA